MAAKGESFACRPSYFDKLSMRAFPLSLTLSLSKGERRPEAAKSKRQP